MLPILFFISSLLLSTFASVLPPSDALTVSLNPTNGQYASIQQAVNALSLTDPTSQYIYVKAGHYHESVTIKPRRASLVIQGEISQGGNDYYYKDNLVTIGHSGHAGQGVNNDDSATLRVHMENFTLRNINIVNEYLEGKAQALALSAAGNKQSYLGSSFTSYIDTINNEKGEQFFGGCYIEGAIDMIFGRTGTAFYRDCDLAITAKKQGWITASGRQADGLQGELIIDHSRINAKLGANVKPESVYLGRPWGTKAMAAVQSTYLSSIINPAGWDVWPGKSNEAGANFYEYGNFGPGASGNRAKFSHSIPEPITINQVFQSTNWIDQRYLKV